LIKPVKVLCVKSCEIVLEIAGIDLGANIWKRLIIMKNRKFL